MRDNIRCLDCGSNRFATFRGGQYAPHQQRPPFYVDSPPKKSYKGKGEKAKYETDYDLSKANEQFKKLMDDGEKSDEELKPEEVGQQSKEQPKEHDPSTQEIAEMLHKASIKPPPPSSSASVYDKASSFFDDISCESKEKNEGSYNPREYQFERHRNQQTFGSVGYAPRPFFNPNMSRGGGGGYYPARKWNPERTRNQQTFGVAAYDSFGGPPGGYFPRKRGNYGSWYPKF